MQIIVIDLGSQYTAIIDRALRELGARALILSPYGFEIPQQGRIEIVEEDWASVPDVGDYR